MNKEKKLYNLSSFGFAVKEARSSGKITREQLAEKLGISVRHLAQIENKGQHPSFQVFYELATMFDISVDQYFYPARNKGYSTKQRQMISTIEQMEDDDLDVLKATANALEAKKSKGLKP